MPDLTTRLLGSCSSGHLSVSVQTLNASTAECRFSMCLSHCYPDRKWASVSPQLMNLVTLFLLQEPVVKDRWANENSLQS